MTLFKKKKKELVAGISIKTVGKTVYLGFNEKMILKAGTVTVDYNTETPNVGLFEWHIGHRNERKWWMIFRSKKGCGVSIEGDSVIISGESTDCVVSIEGGSVLISGESPNIIVPSIEGRNKDNCKFYDKDNCSVPCTWYKCNMVEMGRKNYANKRKP